MPTNPFEKQDNIEHFPPIDRVFATSPSIDTIARTRPADFSAERSCASGPYFSVSPREQQGSRHARPGARVAKQLNFSQQERRESRAATAASAVAAGWPTPVRTPGSASRPATLRDAEMLLNAHDDAPARARLSAAMIAAAAPAPAEPEPTGGSAPDVAAQESTYEAMLAEAKAAEAAEAKAAAAPRTAEPPGRAVCARASGVCHDAPSASTATASSARSRPPPTASSVCSGVPLSARPAVPGLPRSSTVPPFSTFRDGAPRSPSAPALRIRQPELASRNSPLRSVGSARQLLAEARAAAAP